MQLIRHVATKMAEMNSEPKEEVSTMFCHLENQTMGARLQNNKMPVGGLLMILFPVRSASMKQEIKTELPWGSGAFGGIASRASL